MNVQLLGGQEECRLLGSANLLANLALGNGSSTV